MALIQALISAWGIGAKRHPDACISPIQAQESAWDIASNWTEESRMTPMQALDKGHTGIQRVSVSMSRNKAQQVLPTPLWAPYKIDEK